MAHGARTRAAANRYGYVWTKDKVPQTGSAVQLLLAAGRFLQEEKGFAACEALAKLTGDTSDVPHH